MATDDRLEVGAEVEALTLEAVLTAKQGNHEEEPFWEARKDGILKILTPDGASVKQICFYDTRTSILTINVKEFA